MQRYTSSTKRFKETNVYAKLENCRVSNRLTNNTAARRNYQDLNSYLALSAPSSGAVWFCLKLTPDTKHVRNNAFHADFRKQTAMSIV